MLPQVWADIPQKDVVTILKHNYLRIRNKKINVIAFLALIRDGRNPLTLL